MMPQPPLAKLVQLLNRYTIGTRLLGLTLFLSIMMLATGLSGIWGIRQATQAISSIYDQNVTAINDMQLVRHKQMRIRNLALEARMGADAFLAQEKFDEIDKEIRTITETVNAYGQHDMSAEERALFDKYAASRMKFGQEGLMKLRDLYSAENWQGADQHYKTFVNPSFAVVSDDTDALINFQLQAAQSSRDKIATLSNALLGAAITTMAAGLILSIFLSLAIRHSIVHCAMGLEQAAGKLAKGDLTGMANVVGKDELSRVAAAFNRMSGEFANLIGEIRRSAEEVSQAASSTAEDSSAVAEASSRQESVANDTAEAAHNLSTTVARVGENIESMVSVADQASQLARHGEEVVNKAAAGIQAISESVSRSSDVVLALGRHSDEIGRIVNVIKDIADQTNLLALNAAIEAARAGEQGRGFAVVADEVRKLAERTTKATAEISSTIETIQTETGKAVTAIEQGSQEVAQGVEMAVQAGQAIAEINGAVANVTNLIHNIDRIRREQDAASQAIAQRVDDILDMAQKNRGAAESSTQAAQGLTSLSGRLKDAVSRFRLTS
ncbi:MAG: methyl-accepting chemotaxis protein [Betaproteobacteria bacterium]|nr:methyl-accepting chemotaxis protein [Betaproteobacteria bacterium]